MGMIRRNEPLNSVKLVWLNGHRMGPIDVRGTEKPHCFICMVGRRWVWKTGTAREMTWCDCEGCCLVICNSVQSGGSLLVVSEEPVATIITLGADDGGGTFFWDVGTVILDCSVPHGPIAEDGNIDSICSCCHFSIFGLLWQMVAV